MHDTVMDEGCVLSSRSCKALPSAVQPVAPDLATPFVERPMSLPVDPAAVMQSGTIGVAHVTANKRDV